MSIPSLNKPSDYDKYFSRYLADLNLQVKLNQDNYDANVAFFKTGVQATERADTRSLEQRSTDVETLKIQARAMLNKLTNSNAADEVLTFLINNNLLFFFVQNFVDFERTINKRYPSQTASAPILRVLIQKSFDKQNDEIPLLKDELIVATNSVASREIIQKVLTDVYNKQDTNVVLYETLQNNLSMFPTMQEKMNIVKFPEKKYKDETDIAVWNTLPSNKTIEQLLDLYEQLYSEDAENIQSIQNQINNIEDGIENQLSSVTDIKIKSKIDETIGNKRRQVQEFDTLIGRRKQDLLAAEQERKIQQYKQSKAGQQEVLEEFKKKEERKNQQYQQAKEGQEKVIKNLKQKERQKEAIEEFKKYRPKAMEYVERESMIQADLEQRQIREEREKELRVAKANKGRQQTIDPSSYMSASKSVSKPKGNLKPNVAIQEPISAEAVEEEMILKIMPKKVKSSKAKEGPIYTSDISDDLLQPYIDKMDTITTREETKNKAKNEYNIVFDEVKRQYGDKKIATLKRVIAINQYYQDINPMEVSTELEPLNEQTKGSYSAKIFRPDPNVNVIEDMEGKGLLTKRQQDSHRFKVLQGQILAGNNSKKIVMELKALILKMNKLGEISNKKASAVLQELNSVLK